MAHSRKRILALLFALCLTAVGMRVAAAGEDQKINVNAASVAELMTIRGIGEVTANAIVAYREQHGPFKTVDDVVAVKGIGPKSIERFRDQMTVGNGAAPQAQARERK